MADTLVQPVEEFSPISRKYIIDSLAIWCSLISSCNALWLAKNGMMPELTMVEGPISEVTLVA